MGVCMCIFASAAQCVIVVYIQCVHICSNKVNVVVLCENNLVYTCTPVCIKDSKIGHVDVKCPIIQCM